LIHDCEERIFKEMHTSIMILKSQSHIRSRRRGHFQSNVFRKKPAKCITLRLYPSWRIHFVFIISS
jgi:hypothetical protein